MQASYCNINKKNYATLVCGKSQWRGSLGNKTEDEIIVADYKEHNIESDI